MTVEYNEAVAEYYDSEADNFEQRTSENHVVSQLRGFFRAVTLSYKPKRILEIGYGPGLDMIWFADRDEIEVVHGVDITPGFHRIVSEKASSREDSKVIPHLGAAEEIEEIVGNSSVDSVIVFFGALNTTSDLEGVAKAISEVLEPGGVAVLTFVNRWYLFDILWNLALLRPKKAFARQKSVWGGYSPTRHIPSHCPSAREVRRAFRQHLRLVEQKGYCITHPAWYRKQWAPSGSMRTRLCHAIDRIIQYTPFWNLGEYSLYVFELPDSIESK